MGRGMRPTVAWTEGEKGPCVQLLDQTRLPLEEVVVECYTVEELCDAIKRLVVRGAPAIGCSAALGMALAARLSTAGTGEELLEELRRARDQLAATRPTAVNLFWALERMMKRAEDVSSAPPAAITLVLIAEAQLIVADDLARCHAIGEHGAELIGERANILTHCNAGALATSGYGTALGVIRAAHSAGKQVHVWVDETRPLLQGARLTAWELMKEEIPCTVICDNAAACLMREGKVDCVVVGADRIAANGDVANKIGTYALACLCEKHGLPFYVAAPLSTVDLGIATGADIPIEERAADEVCNFSGQRTCPAGVRAYNPAFDVTPHELVSAIITEHGVIRAPYADSLQAAVARNDQNRSAIMPQRPAQGNKHE